MTDLRADNTPNSGEKPSCEYPQNAVKKGIPPMDAYKKYEKKCKKINPSLTTTKKYL